MLANTSIPAAAAEWQWSVSVKNEHPENGPARAFLWIPANCAMVRGVDLAQHNMEELSILENPGFRRALSDLAFAEVWVAPMFDHAFDFTHGAAETFEDLMSRLAEVSGYAELKLAPIAGLGHSAAASWPYYFAALKPERTLAALSVSGQWPYVRNQFAPDIWGERHIDFIPCLETMGEYESAASWSTEGLRERQDHPLMPLSMLACPAEGHFAASEEKIDFLAFYLKKAAQYRLPKGWDGASAPKLNPLDPARTGWLADKWRKDQAPTANPAPVGQYRGDPKDAFWYFDEETACAVENYGARHRGKKPQLVGYVQDGKMAAQHNSHLQVDLKFEPEADGVTFHLRGEFYDAVPSGSPRLPGWTGLPTNSPLGHAASGPVAISRICGPFAPLGPEVFALRLGRENTTNETRYELVFAAKHPGDGEYKAAVQQAHMFVPARNIQGAEQHILFPEIAGQKLGAKSVKLKATSDSGAKVYYYVREGPAEVEGDTLILTAVPPRAKFPVAVTVVAWQYGRASEPKLKTAAPVERTFLIMR